MPGLDGTGPMGMGPMTGGGRGFCSPWGIRAVPSGYGYPRWTGYSYPYYGAYRRGFFGAGVPPFAPRVTREQELEFLKTESQTLSEELRRMEAMIKVLEGGAEA
jgi:hypothetical protein